MARTGSPVPPVNGDEGRAGRFYAGTHEARSGRSAQRARQDFAEKCWKAWDEFDKQPGTYLRLEWVGIARRELRSAEQQTIATMSSTWWDILGTRGISGIDGRFSTSNGSFVLKRTRYAWELVDKTGTPILYTGGRNFDRIAGASISLPDERSLRFPVLGTHRANAIMTAVDEAGKSIFRYRLIPGPGSILRRRIVEIAVHPDWKLTEELALSIAISAPWLRSYFSEPWNGHPWSR